MSKAEEYYSFIDAEHAKGQAAAESIRDTMQTITNHIPVRTFNVEDRVKIASKILGILSLEERKELATQLLEEQVSEQREKLNHWSAITAQYLVSLQTQIAGQGMRGKGDDLCDGSEVKSANFLDSLDKKGATAPRWNFTAVTRQIMERFLEYPAVYLLSMDLNAQGCFRTRIWKVDVTKHTVLRERYKEWMNVLGYPKFASEKEESVNFQLFPPHIRTEESFARHGNGRKNGFTKLEIPLENCEGSELIFRADEIDGKIVISKF